MDEKKSFIDYSSVEINETVKPDDCSGKTRKSRFDDSRTTGLPVYIGDPKIDFFVKNGATKTQ
uniref:Uncharacterized protein n=1 Tax=Romanomermis culicivorax TaxID=13658 RepID=A0A915JXE6_ROMCU